MAALQYVDFAGYAAILFRRTFADLNQPEALIPRSMEWLAGTDADWNGQLHQWTFPSGAILKFGHLQHEQDKYAYQGAAFQFIGFDELTQFTETMYTYLMSRLRRLEGFPVPLRQRGSANPGGIGHEWVKQRFLVEGRKKGRVFVPSKLEDNPSLDRADYDLSLAELDPVTRDQLRKGDWDVLPKGPLFDRAWFRTEDTIPWLALERGRQVRFWDLAATEPKAGNDPDWTVGLRLLEHEGMYWVLDVQRIRARPQAVEDLIKSTAENDGKRVEIWMEQEPGSSGVNTIDHYERVALKGYTFRGNRATGNKYDRARPVSSAAERGRITLGPGTWRTELLNELHVFPTKGHHDDQVDALSGAFEKVSTGYVPDPPAAPEEDEQKPNEVGREHISNWVTSNVDI